MKNIFKRLGVHIPEILLPVDGTDLTKWAVIACDQYTSQPEYWDKVSEGVGQNPSTLKLTFPEIYLKDDDKDKRIESINKTMEEYLIQGTLEPQDPGFILVDRSTPHTSSRKGLIIALDLECYDYRPGAQTLIRATEGTVLDRIPPRVRIRENAPIELPHIMVLIDDSNKAVIEGLYAKAEAGGFKKLYDFELMQGGGHIKGWKVDDKESLSMVAKAFDKLERGSCPCGSDTIGDDAIGDSSHLYNTSEGRTINDTAADEAIGEASVEASVEASGEALVEASGEALVEASGEALGKASGETSGETSGEAIVKASSKASGEATGKAIDMASGEAIGMASGEVSEEAVANTCNLLFAVGDGNHSLASAKAHWENVKASLIKDTNEPIPEHPARYALVELVNVHDDGLVFEPIHRVLFNINATTILEMLNTACSQVNMDQLNKVRQNSSQLCLDYRFYSSREEMENVLEKLTNEQQKLSDNYTHLLPFILEGKYGILTVDNPVSNIEVGTLQSILDLLLKNNPEIEVDYIHGDQVVTELGSKAGTMGFYLPVMSKHDLFPTVKLDGVLPRKTFSMGEAEEKRYYLECRRIR